MNSLYTRARAWPRGCGGAGCGGAGCEPPFQAPLALPTQGSGLSQACIFSDAATRGVGTGSTCLLGATRFWGTPPHPCDEMMCFRPARGESGRSTLLGVRVRGV